MAKIDDPKKLGISILDGNTGQQLPVMPDQQTATPVAPVVTPADGLAKGGEPVAPDRSIGYISGSDGSRALTVDNYGRANVGDSLLTTQQIEGMNAQADNLPGNIADRSREALLSQKGLPSSVQVHDTGGFGKVVDVVDVPLSGVMPGHRFASTGVTVMPGKSPADFAAETAKASAIYGQKRQEPVYGIVDGKQVVTGSRDVTDTAKIADTLTTEAANKMRAESDQAKLQLDRDKLVEDKRHNIASEGLSATRIAKTGAGRGGARSGGINRDLKKLESDYTKLNNERNKQYAKDVAAFNKAKENALVDPPKWQESPTHAAITAQMYQLRDIAAQNHGYDIMSRRPISRGVTTRKPKANRPDINTFFSK